MFDHEKLSVSLTAILEITATLSKMGYIEEHRAKFRIIRAVYYTSPATDMMTFCKLKNLLRLNFLSIILTLSGTSTLMVLNKGKGDVPSSSLFIENTFLPLR
jgi:hypothetical protein